MSGYRCLYRYFSTMQQQVYWFIFLVPQDWWWLWCSLWSTGQPSICVWCRFWTTDFDFRLRSGSSLCTRTVLKLSNTKTAAMISKCTYIWFNCFPRRDTYVMPTRDLRDSWHHWYVDLYCWQTDWIEMSSRFHTHLLVLNNYFSVSILFAANGSTADFITAPSTAGTWKCDNWSIFLLIPLRFLRYFWDSVGKILLYPGNFYHTKEEMHSFGIHIISILQWGHLFHAFVVRKMTTLTQRDRAVSHWCKTENNQRLCHAGPSQAVKEKHPPSSSCRSPCKRKNHPRPLLQQRMSTSLC